jgi:preprotein translocase subunit SecD
MRKEFMMTKNWVYLGAYLRTTVVDRFMTNFSIVLALALTLSSSSFASGYVSNALLVEGVAGKPLLSNRDIRCVGLSKDSNGKSVVTFKLSEAASRSLSDYTAQNIGKTLSISICGQPGTQPKIMSPISSGAVNYSGLNDFQLQCLKDSFEMNTKCSDCPVCKN